MTKNKRFELVLNDDGKPISIKGGYTTITSLEQRFDENLKKDRPVVSACVFGTSPTTGKRMVLKVILSEV